MHQAHMLDRNQLVPTIWGADSVARLAANILIKSADVHVDTYRPRRLHGIQFSSRTGSSRQHTFVQHGNSSHRSRSWHGTGRRQCRVSEHLPFLCCIRSTRQKDMPKLAPMRKASTVRLQDFRSEDASAWRRLAHPSPRFSCSQPAHMYAASHHHFQKHTSRVWLAS